MTALRVYLDKDATLAEVNPLAITKKGDVVVLDAKFDFDDNALFRTEIAALRDLNEENPAEVRAAKANLNFIELDGTIGCLVNGAELAMGTMDIIKYHGGNPANFLDVGGSVSSGGRRGVPHHPFGPEGGDPRQRLRRHRRLRDHRRAGQGRQGGRLPRAGGRPARRERGREGPRHSPEGRHRVADPEDRARSHCRGQAGGRVGK